MHVFQQRVKAAHGETIAKVAGYKDAVSEASKAVKKEGNAVREARSSLETLLDKLDDARKTGDVVDGVVSILSV
jgi:outer membrane protein TolC